MIEDLFKVLSEDITEVTAYEDYITDKKGTIIFVQDALQDRIKQGTYYRKGHEPKREPLTAEDLDNRGDLRVIRELTRYTIMTYDSRVQFFDGNKSIWMDYEDLAEYTFVSDGSPCSKGGE